MAIRSAPFVLLFLLAVVFYPQQSTSAIPPPTQQEAEQPSAKNAVTQQPPAAAQQSSAAGQQSSAAGQQSSAADQLRALLGPVVEAAVSRALADQRLAGATDGRRALSELGRLEGRLDSAAHGLAELQLQFARLEAKLEARDAAKDDSCSQTCALRAEPKSKPETEREPRSESDPDPKPEGEPGIESESEAACEQQPAPLPAGTDLHQDPARRACAGSCLQLRDRVDSPQDGVYWFTNMTVPVLCDFSHDGGGWTLLLTVAAREGWNSLSVLRRNERSPSLTDNYAILGYADAIRDLGKGGRFAYRIEAQAETGRRHWGGIWLAPRHYSFVHESPSQTGVSRAAKFGPWEYKDTGIEKRMPWVNFGAGSPVLTTSASSTTQWFGTLVTHDTNAGYNFSPWIHEQALHSGKVLYWLREEMI